MVGHYGTPALIAGGAALALLVLHVAVPFGFVDLPDAQNDAGIEDETLKRSDAGDMMDPLPLEYGLASLGITMTGIILALVGGIMLVVFGFLPVPVATARVLGWVGALLGAMGSWFAFSASLFPMGAGFATLLGVLFQNEHEVARIWFISPVIVALLSGYLLLLNLKIMAGVVTTQDGLRESAQKILRGPVLAAMFLFAVLVMPWAWQIQDGEERFGSTTGATTFYTAWGVTMTTENANPFMGILEVADATDGNQDLWQGLAFGLRIMIAAAWVTFFLAVVSTLGHVIASITHAPIAPRITGAFQLGNIVTLPWATVHFILACAYQWKPSWDADIVPKEQSWWFGFLPLLGAGLLVLWILQQVRANMSVVHATRAMVAKQAAGHSFD